MCSTRIYSLRPQSCFARFKEKDKGQGEEKDKEQGRRGTYKEAEGIQMEKVCMTTGRRDKRRERGRERK